MSVYLLITVFLFSCKTIRESKETSYNSRESSENTSHLTYLYYARLDSVIRVPAPLEKSTSYGLKNSILETSLSICFAEVDSLGQLTHQIQNKDSIYSKVVYLYDIQTVRDSVDIVKNDTIKHTEYIKETTGLSIWQSVQIWAGRILIAGLLIGLIYLVIKWKLRF